MALAENDPKKAEGLADRAIASAQNETDPAKYAAKWPLAVDTRAKVAMAAGDYTGAHEYARQVLQKFPKDKNAISLYHMTDGRDGAAPASTPAAAPSNANASRAAAPAPNYTPAAPAVKPYLDRAAALLGMRDYRGAIEAAGKASELDPSNPDPHMQAAVAWAALKNLTQALLEVTKTIERLQRGDPRLAGAYSTRALYKNKTGDAAGAVEDADAAIKLNPGGADAFYQRSVAFAALGRRAASLEDLKKAAELKPSDYQSLYETAARETAAAPAAPAGPSAWSKLTGATGGVLPLVVGGVGGLFFIFAGYVLFFAKENSRMKRWLTPAAQPLSESGDYAKVVGGHIQIQGELDRGGMGVVLKGFDTRLRRAVAVKRLRPELQERESERKRILDEAQTLAKFHHPNIVDIYEAVPEGDDIYIVCPLLEGRTVHSELNAAPGRKLEPRRALEILRPVAEAIDHAHAKGVIHRDLKPSNIMLAADGRVLVMDFGIAKNGVNHSRVTMTDTVAGTPPYMAPEQGWGAVSRQSDLFALGVTAYEMLTGALPFGPNNEHAKREDRPGRFLAASSVTPSLPAAVDAVLEKALSAEPAKRHKTCAEFCRALDDALQATPRA